MWYGTLAIEASAQTKSAVNAVSPDYGTSGKKQAGYFGGKKLEISAPDEAVLQATKLRSVRRAIIMA